LRTVVRPLQEFQAAIDELRANPNHLTELAGNQPGELGQLTSSFEALMEDLRRSRHELTVSIDKMRTAARLFGGLKEGVLVTDPNGIILSVNPALSRVSGYEPEDLIGQKLTVLHSGKHDPTFYSTLWETLRQTGQWQGEIWNQNKSGQPYGQWLSIQAVVDRRGEVRSYVGLYADLTKDT
jgi:PAS domain S-box-containing protein